MYHCGSLCISLQFFDLTGKVGLTNKDSMGMKYDSGICRSHLAFCFCGTNKIKAGLLSQWVNCPVSRGSPNVST